MDFLFENGNKEKRLDNPYFLADYKVVKNE